MRKRFGFTLIELLVVIAIIAILAAMLFPVFARARESARKIQCLSNVKNIAIAFQIYLTDYDAFPPSEHRAEVLSYFNSGPGGGAPASFVTGCLQDNLVHPNPYLAWPVILDEYVKNRDVWRCPSARRAHGTRWVVPGPDWLGYLRSTQGKWGVSQPDCAGGPCCFAWPPGWGGSVTDSVAQRLQSSTDTGAFDQSIATTKNYDMKTARIDDPSWFVVCGDGGVQVDVFQVSFLAFPEACYTDCGGTPANQCESCAATCNTADNCGITYMVKNSGQWWTDATFRKQYTRHMGGSNLGFADGHASWMPAEEIIANAPRSSNPNSGKIRGAGYVYELQ
jgi:prepilin-type N-terminal cleavage/methylation domain-containing protein/prepilin-type processing-associated H-X9-DG protein